MQRLGCTRGSARRLRSPEDEMLRITINDEGVTTAIKLEGRLAGLWVDQLRRCWLRAASEHEARAIRLDLCEVGFVDEDGRKLLQQIHEAGAELRATGLMVRSILEEISHGSGEGRGTRNP
jgi:predicted RNA-binding protein YlxR (DUF448 family)